MVKLKIIAFFTENQHETGKNLHSEPRLVSLEKFLRTRDLTELKTERFDSDDIRLCI